MQQDVQGKVDSRAMREVNRRYPKTEYALDARLKIDLVNDHLGGKEMESKTAHAKRVREKK